MIQDFRHKGLRQFFETGSTAGIQASLERKLRFQLAALHSATQIEDMDLPGYRLHLRSIWVNGNWRLTFAFRDGHVFDLDVEDDHGCRCTTRLTPAPSSKGCISSRVPSPSTVQRLVAGKSRVSPDRALRLSRVLGRSAESWLAMQDSYDLWQARQSLDLSGLTPMELTAA